MTLTFLGFVDTPSYIRPLGKMLPFPPQLNLEETQRINEHLSTLYYYSTVVTVVIVQQYRAEVYA